MIAPEVQEQILNKLNTLIVVLNNDGSIDYVSKSASQLLGYEPQQLLGNNWWHKTRFDKPEGMLIKNKIVKRFEKDRDTVNTFEHLLKTRAGTEKWFSWNVSALNDEQLIGIGHDITDKKHFEKRLTESNQKLLQQNKDITDSINYAKRVQLSILQRPEHLKVLFGESFVLYKPKDIVSGDYYFFHSDSRYNYVAAVDCTGHGVPGAMMSMVANSIFKEVFLNLKISDPKEILYALDKELSKAINNYSDVPSYDGMDIALVRIENCSEELCFAGAFRSIIISGKDSLTEIKGSRYPLGFYSDAEKTFENNYFPLQKSDCVYLFSDGFADQFGGNGTNASPASQTKKLNKSNFKELLKTASEMDMCDQEAFLDYSLNNWKQDAEQTDDILVIGFKI